MKRFIPYAAYAAVAVVGYIVGRVTAPGKKDKNKE